MQKKSTHLGTWPICLTRTLKIESDRDVTQNSIKNNGIIKTTKDLKKEWSNQAKGLQMGLGNFIIRTGIFFSISCNNCVFIPLF